MAAWNRVRSVRTGRTLRNRFDNCEDLIKIDFDKDPTENVKEILRNIVQRQGVTKTKKLAYLNYLVKFFQNVHTKHQVKLTLQEILVCLRVSLFSDAREIRAAGLRAIRYLLQDEAAIEALWKLQFHHLIARSLDIFLDNQTERLQAMRIMRKVIHICPQKFPPAFTLCLMSIANDGYQERDHLLRAALATLSELVILNNDVITQTGLITSLIRNILDSQHARIVESLVGTIIFLLNKPKTRCFIKPKIDLERIVAPLTDCHYRHTGDVAEFDDKEIRFAASKMAILSALRSWPGMIRLCRPGESGLQSLIDVLYLPNEEVRKIILDILFELFRLPVPEWTEDFSVALLASDSSTMQESWKLYDGFIVEEGKNVLPHIGYQRPNLLENYMALLLFALINVGILEAMVKVIVTSSSKLSIRATILLGELLHIANTRLPHECSHHSHCLPTLISVAVSFDSPPEHRYCASAAISCLNRLHSLKKRGTLPCSIFLEQLIQFASKNPPRIPETHHQKDRPMASFLQKDADELTNQAIKESQVLTGREPDNWDWNAIDAIFKLPGNALQKLEDNHHKQFLRRIVQFYKPTSKQFSTYEQNREESRRVVKVGCRLVDFLVNNREAEAARMLEEFLVDFGLCLSQVIVERAPLDAIFSPSKMMSTLSQCYFLYVGRVARSRKSREVLERNGILQCLLKLVSVTSHESYLKLVISSLDYSQDGMARIILSKVLNASPESSRLFATNLIRILVRLRLQDFHKWGMELLATQVYDESRAVSLAALDILDEACDDMTNLESLINLRPSLLHLGDRGQLLLVRFLSLPIGFKYLNNANYVNHEMEKWKKSYCLKYVKIVEEELNDALTRHQRGEDGNFQRRTNQRHVIRDVYIPPHLYGQLAQHKDGFELLIERDVLPSLIQAVRLQEMQTDEQILHLKAAIWALGHIASSTRGVLLLNEEQIIQDIIKLAEESPVFSIRGTAFNSLGLIALTPTGANLLSQLGWESVRYNRREQWPIVKDIDHSQETFVEIDMDDDAVRSRESSQASTEELDGRSPSILLPENLNGFDTALNRFRPSPSLDSDILQIKSRTLPHPRTRFDDYVHQRTVSEPQDPTVLHTESSSSLQASPLINYDKPRLNISGNRERNRSRSFNETTSIFNGSMSTECGEKLRSISNIEIMKSDTKDERADSNESSNTSKSRSDSYTDSTSGIGSSDSSTGRLGVVNEHAQTLSPIASSTSLNTLSNRVVHHSDSIRKLVNLRYTPVIPRRTNQSSHDPVSPDWSYTMTRDVAGYAALRSVQRRRIISVDADPWNIARDKNTVHVSKARSLESGRDSAMYRLYTDFLHSTPHTIQRPFSAMTHPSTSSMYGMLKENEGNDIKYMGICLPVDINMIFSTDDQEDFKSNGLSRIEEHSEWKNASNTGRYKDGFEYHSVDNCLKCTKVLAIKKSITPIKEATDSEFPPSINGCDDVLVDTIAGSFSSAGSIDAVADGVTIELGDDSENQILVRKEVLRLVASLSSSAAVKSSEQGLLSLKQKLPNTFHDLCLYSEILHVMSTYKFRLTARRFLHELFMDVVFSELYEEPYHILHPNNFVQSEDGVSEP